MSGLNPFKLQKFRIEAFDKPERRRTDRIGSFEAMFNPTSLSQSFSSQDAGLQTLNSSGRSGQYIRALPKRFSVSLLLDGTGVTTAGFNPFKEKSVTKQINTFLNLTYDYNGKIHRSNFLKISWGSNLDGFKCVLEGVDINHTLFKRNGDPLRATLSASFIEDQAAQQRQSEEGKSSPDLTHEVKVSVTDTLTNIAAEYYSDPSLYLPIAEHNQLDTIRKIVPGTKLIVPPLEVEDD